MKKIKIITVLASFALILLSTSNSKANNLQLINSNLLIILNQENNLLIDMVCNAQYAEFNETSTSLDAYAESEILIEQSLEMQEWMMEYNWMENSSVLSEKELELELWMESPKNWNIYHCK